MQTLYRPDGTEVSDFYTAMKEFIFWPIASVRYITTYNEAHDKKNWKSGDLIIVEDEVVDRNEGKYLWNGTNIVTLDKQYDDYGHIPKSFNVIDKYPINYWSFILKNGQRAIMHNIAIPFERPVNYEYTENITENMQILIFRRLNVLHGLVDNISLANIKPTPVPKSNSKLSFIKSLQCLCGEKESFEDNSSINIISEAKGYVHFIPPTEKMTYQYIKDNNFLIHHSIIFPDGIPYSIQKLNELGVRTEHIVWLGDPEVYGF
jgi:hypothetical protein